MSRKILSLIFIGCLTASLSNLWGQATSTLNGTILDSTGAVVPGAAVVVTNDATKLESKTTSTSAGAYTVPYIAEGTYTISVVAPGFRKAIASNVVLRAAQTLTVNITLEVGQVTEQVTVSDTPPLLEAGTAEVGRYINQEEFKAWPIFTGDGQRQIQEFIFDSLPGTTGGTFQGSINGGQQYSHEILIDGMALGRADLSGGNNNEMSPSLDAIGDFKLQTGAVSAEYNGGQTAVANFSIKSGTNDLHGAVFEYLQNEDFNALDIGATQARYRDNNWGYTAGGPVWIPKIYKGRNKSFWFTNFEHDKRNQMNTSGFSTLAPMAYRTGDFSQMLNPNFTGNSKLAGKEIGTDALGRPIMFNSIYDPSTTRLVNGQVVRDVFPGNIIPTNRINPVSAAILQVGLVDPTLPSKMYNNIQHLSSGQPFFDEHIIGIKVDQIINDKNRISVFYNQGYRERNNVAGSNSYLPVPGPPTTTWQDQLTPSNMARLNITSTITPTLINNFGLGYSRFVNDNGSPLAIVNQNWAQKIGIQNTSPLAFPDFNFSGAPYQGGSIAKIGVGWYGGGANGAEVLKDDATKIWGRHTFHFGYQYTVYRYDEENYSDSGNFYFNPIQTGIPGLDANGNSLTTETGNAFASFMLGAAQHASHGISGLSDGFRGPYHASWIQDDYKITPKLTMNIGFRWEVITPFYERTNRMSYIDLGVPNPSAGNLLGELVFKNRPTTTYWGEIGPRFGIAYQVNNKIVVRMGYAMMNTPPITENWGYGGFTTGYSGSVSVPTGTSPTGFTQDPAFYLNQPMPSQGFTLPDTNPADGNFNASQTVTPDANRPGYVQNWNLTIQYLLPYQMVVEGAYVGNHGTRVWGFNEVDVSPATKLALGDTLLDQVSQHPSYIPYAGFPTDLSVAQAILPYPQFYGISNFYAYNTNSNYHSFQLTVTKHLTKGLGFLAAYTFSKTMGYQDSNGATGYGVPQDFMNRKLEYSLATFNQTNNLKLTWTYDTPFGKGRRWDLKGLNYVLGGWQLAGLQNYASGFPLEVYSNGLNTPTGFGSIRPDIVSSNLASGGFPSSADYSTPSQYLNQAAFVNVPTTGNGVPLTVGTAPRNLNLRGFPTLSETMRMSKALPFFKEKAKFKVGMTMSNPFKRKYVYITDSTVGDPQFGQVLGGGGGRTMQLDGRIDW
ncbi:MAG: carboxypeptidase-like regulatory domain-containing protein [Bryobacteraceae bacterium]